MEESAIKEYNKMYHPCICIMTPCYNGMCHVPFVNSLMQSIKILEKYDINYHCEFLTDESLIPKARNNLLAKCFSMKHVTHFLYIDADICWSPVNILTLLMSDKCIVGGVYPKKKIKWEKITSKSKQIPDLLEKNKQFKSITDQEFLQYNVVDYNVKYLNDSIELINGLTKVDYIPCGFMMIKRCVIEKMQQAFPNTKYTDETGYLNEEENKCAFALFDSGVAEGKYYTEYEMFCERWKKMGGSIWINISVNLTHIGNHYFKGSLYYSLI